MSQNTIGLVQQFIKTGTLQTRDKFSLRKITNHKTTMSMICRRPYSEQPKFCKVITNPEADYLRIPKEFASRHGHDLSRHVVLKIPSSCKLWEVEVFKSDGGEIFLKNGWEDFKEHFSVKLGGFMVFMFNGSSVFDVFIYDMTCTSIEYPSSDEDSDEETVSESYGNCALLGERSKPQKGKEKIDGIYGSVAPGKKLDDGCSCSRDVLQKKRGKTYRQAAAFKATIPRDITSFITIMGDSNTSHQYCLSIPVLTARDFLSNGFNTIKLHVMGGETYFAKCSVSKEKARITSGWKEVVVDYHLKPGDCCVIQVSRNNKLEWYVTIFKK